MSDKFLVRDSNNNILRVYPLDGIAHPAPKPGETHELLDENIILYLPESFYSESTRPGHIKLTGPNSFDLIPGEYGKSILYNFACTWTDKICHVTVTRKCSQHKFISKADALYTDLDQNSLGNIIESTIPEAVDTDFNGEISVISLGQSFNANFVNGVANFDLNYAGYELADYAPVSIGDINTNLPWPVESGVSNLAKLRLERNKRLKACDWLIMRQTTQTQTNGVTATLSNADYDALLVYMQALRDLPGNTQDPENPTWPTKPSFMG